MRCAPPVLALLVSSCSVFDPQVGPLNTACGDGSQAEAGTYGPYRTTSAVSAGNAVSDAGGASPAIYGPVSGNVLIADQYNNRVIEVTRSGMVVWSFGDGSNIAGPTSVVAPNDAERLPGRRTLISGTGAPSGGDPACPSAGCPDNRVLIVDDDTGAILWQYGGSRGASGSGSGPLSLPVAAVVVPSQGGEDVLITDQGNDRVIQVSESDKAIVWQFPLAGSAETLTTPNSAERLGNGHTLISDEGGNRVIEVDGSGAVTWQYPAAIDTKTLNAPAFASRLPDGNTLITDGGNNRILEVDSASPTGVVWSYSTANRNPCAVSPMPSRAVRLTNGHTLVTNQFNDQLVEVDHSPQAKVLYTYGELGVSGTGWGLLWAPYDAKVVGDYTGLTPPE